MSVPKFKNKWRSRSKIRKELPRKRRRKRKVNSEWKKSYQKEEKINKLRFYKCSSTKEDSIISKSQKVEKNK